MHLIISFLGDSLRLLVRGGRGYWLWMGFLAAIAAVGLFSYGRQASTGLIVTGMSDQVSWGFYIANFTFLVGVAAAAVMLVIPAYLFHRQDVKEAVVLGEGIAVAAVVMCMLFVSADLGRPERFWHLIPVVGMLNFPSSLLVWDVLVLTGYLLLNLVLAFSYLLAKYGNLDHSRWFYYFPLVLLSIGMAVSIHTVTAFLFAANVARPFWNTAVLAPRFLASAFASGPAIIMLTLQAVTWITQREIHYRVIHLLGVIVTVAMQIHLFLLGVELFTEFYNQAEHSLSAVYLFAGLDGRNALTPWIWTSMTLGTVAVFIMSVRSLRSRRSFMNVACVLAIVSIWIEKGMGLVITGFIPSTIGEIVEYLPTTTEVLVSVGILAIGAMVFTATVKVAVPVEKGEVKYRPPQAVAPVPAEPAGHEA